MMKSWFLRFYGKSKLLTNKVSNGDMSDGTTGWQHYSTYSTESIVSGELKSLKNSVKPYVGNTSTWEIEVGHKLYIAAKLYGNKASSVKFELYRKLGVQNDTALATISVTTTPTRFSTVLTVASVTVNGLVIDGTGYTSSGDYIMIDDVVVVDLTADFGAGNEPTAAQMDAALAYLPGSWFDGTQNILWTA